MGLFFSETFNTLEELFVAQLQDLYDAEQRQIKAYDHLSDAANDGTLKSAFSDAQTESERQKARLESVFEAVGEKVKAKTCDAMKGIVSEAEAMVGATGDSDVKDAALIAAGQRIAHYDIVGYGCLRNFARQLGHDKVAEMLDQSCDESGSLDQRLTQMAESRINAKAGQA